MHAQQIYETVSSDFQAVDTLIKDQLFSRVPLVESIGRYITDSGGKRMRPLVVLLTANALGQASQTVQQDYIKLAAIIEFLHTPTLLYDDVFDTSELRPCRCTVNAKLGNSSIMLVCEVLYSRPFEMKVA